MGSRMMPGAVMYNTCAIAGLQASLLVPHTAVATSFQGYVLLSPAFAGTMHEARLVVDLERGEEQFYPSSPGISHVPSSTNLAAAGASTGGGLHRRHPSSNSVMQQGGAPMSAPMSPTQQGGRGPAPSGALAAAAAAHGSLLDGIGGSSGDMTTTAVVADTYMESSEVSGTARTGETASCAPETTSNTAVTGGTQSTSDEMEGEVASISSADASAYLTPSPGLVPHSPSRVQQVK